MMSLLQRRDSFPVLFTPPRLFLLLVLRLVLNLVLVRPVLRPVLGTVLADSGVVLRRSLRQVPERVQRLGESLERRFPRNIRPQVTLLLRGPSGLVSADVGGGRPGHVVGGGNGVLGPARGRRGGVGGGQGPLAALARKPGRKIGGGRARNGESEGGRDRIVKVCKGSTACDVSARW